MEIKKQNRFKNFYAALFIFNLLAGSLLFLPTKMEAQIGLTPVGGRFLPGLFDIYTPTLFCGVIVSVVGPNPGVFMFIPTEMHLYFPETFSHVGNNMLGMAVPTPPCPSTLFMVGSSLTP